MATLLDDIAITQLTKKAHNRLIQKTFSTATSCETIRLRLPNTLEQLHLAAVKESASMLHLSRSLYTPEITAADDEMDAALSHFKAGLRFFKDCEDPEKKKAAEFLYYIVKDSDVSQKGTMSSQLGIIPEFIAQCEGVYASYIRELGMEPELARLKAATERLNELLADRTEELSTVESGVNKAARAESDVAWHGFRIAFNGYVLENGDAGVASFTATMNEKIRYLKRWDLHESAPGPEAGEEATEGGEAAGGEAAGGEAGAGTPGAGGESGGGNGAGGGTGESGGGSGSGENTGGDSGSTTPRYTITYMHDGQVYATQEYEVGATVTPPTPPTGYFWLNRPSTMPARNVTCTSYEDDGTDI